MIEINGANGGGQILRSALTLSMVTGKSFQINNIRGKRSRSGLLRQHLVAVKAAKAISQAETIGADFKSTQLQFIPHDIEGGEYQFAIEGAGSTTLVLQTLIPALFYAKKPSRITISGGTHNPMAPPFHFLKESWLPLMRRMNANLSLNLKRYGFMPKGGGLIEAVIEPSKLQSLMLTDSLSTNLSQIEAEFLIAGLPLSIAERELIAVKKQLSRSLDQERIIPISSDQGPGNLITLKTIQDDIINGFIAFGMKGRQAEKVAEEAVNALNHFLISGACVSDRLADQLLLPLALSGGGELTTSRISNHLETNRMVIEAFLPVAIDFREQNKQINIKIRSLDVLNSMNRVKSV